MPPIRQLTLTEVFDALNRYISKKIYRNFKPILIHDVKMFDAFVYTLTTCYERRYTKWQFCPYKPDDPLDEPTRTRKMVDPWLVDARPEGKFKQQSVSCKVPRSNFVMTCSKCTGVGTVTCPWCDGNGKDPFGKCTLCSGSGKYKCKICDGHRKIKLYLVTKVKWSTKMTSMVVDTSNSGIKDETFLKGASTVVLDEELESVPFIAQLFDDTNVYQARLAEAANHVILTHESDRGKFKKIVLQRQTVRHIPVAAIGYNFQKQDHKFHIIGNEKKVVFHRSPSLLCSIL